jgi:hypothetical protein
MTILNFLNQVEQQERSQSQQWHRHYTSVHIQHTYHIVQCKHARIYPKIWIWKNRNSTKNNRAHICFVFCCCCWCYWRCRRHPHHPHRSIKVGIIHNTLTWLMWWWYWQIGKNHITRNWKRNFFVLLYWHMYFFYWLRVCLVGMGKGR